MQHSVTPSKVKWPWNWQSSATINTYPFSGVHGCYPNGEWPYECAAAYDLGIANDGVLNSKDGVVTFTSSPPVSSCGSDLGYGNYVEAAGIRYAHLSAFAPGVVQNTHLLQGDAVGTQGHTGNVQPCDPNDPQSGKHLHWQFLSGTVPTIDGGSGTSSNSAIGEYSTAGLALRTYYTNHGGWNNIGWTTKHCPGTCTLNMTANNTWGRMQDFQHDPGFFGTTFDTIHVANWDQAHAYLVDDIFWDAWAGGAYDVNGALRPIRMARQDRLGTCPAGSTPACIGYQRFHLGYVWMDTGGARRAAFCPDVYPLPDGDGGLGAQDAQWVFSVFKAGPAGYDWRADIFGDGDVSTQEAQLVFAEFQHGVLDCHP